MKTLLFSVCLAVAAVATAPAQTSPSPVSKSSAQESPTLTPEERTKAIDYLKQTQKEFLASIAGVSEAQWKFKAGPDRWFPEPEAHLSQARGMVELAGFKVFLI